MFDLFFRKKAPPSPPPGPGKQGFTQPSIGRDLLALPRRQKLIENIWQRTSLSREQFASLYRDPLERYADLVQQLPASENHHHAYPGGLLDHGLEIVAYALKIRQNYLLPIGAPPESQAAQAEAWSAAVAYGALLHDLGKIAVDIEVVHEDGKPWHPWHGRIEKPYRFRYVKGRDYQLHSAASALVYFQVLPPHVLDWLSGYRELWSSLIFVLAGQYQHAGVLGEMIVQADQASVAQELGANPHRAMEAPRNTIQRQLADGLRTLVIEKFKLNQPDGPSDGWLTQDALWLVSKPASDQLRALMLSQGVEGIPTSNAPFFNLIQDQAIIQVNAQDKAIWKATIDTGHGWKNTFTLLKVAPALIWPDPADRPAPFSGIFTLEQTEDGPPGIAHPGTASDITLPSHPISQDVTNVTSSQAMAYSETLPQPAFQTGLDPMEDILALADDLFAATPQAPAVSAHEAPTLQDVDNLSEHVIAATTHSRAESITTADLGQAFIAWSRQGVLSHKLLINDAKAMIHTVDGTAFLVSPGLFKRYAQEHPHLEIDAKARQLDPWQLVQRAFEKLKQHRKTADNLNIWTCEVVGPRKTKSLKGYLLEDPKLIFNQPPFDNCSLRLQETGAVEE
ncbi:MobH family relaxase [Pseudomonas oryzihabitans]|uniref:MobH family relaxase n=1 Tax=Pseudomonas oryzihabitans TaxID=47885 RepID=UPI00119EF4A2|nr:MULTISPECIES: MobH family relaxase [Pseudomonas]UUW72307.1 TraI domain-containing protein [Pseudomonas psychrotolerans]